MFNICLDIRNIKYVVVPWLVSSSTVNTRTQIEKYWLSIVLLLKRSPWSDKKVSGRQGIFVALPTTAGWREGDRICPALTETFMSLQGDLHSIGYPWT